MDKSTFPLIAILLPFLMAFIIGFIKEKYITVKRILVVLTTIVSLIYILILIPDVFMHQKILTYWFGNWIPKDGWAVGIGLEIDALSLFVGLIISIACVISSVYSIKYMSKDNGLGKYYTLFLLLTGSMIGFVFTGDLFNMYVMLEIMTFSAIALTAFRTEKDKALEAGFKYLVIGGLGSTFILLGTALIYAEAHTLNIAQIALIFNSENTKSSPTMILALAFMLVGYAVKSFMVPCHTWPPDAHMSAPSSISMLLSGVMSKTGVYGLIRILFMIFGLSGNKSIAYLIIIWGVITMVVGVSMALLQSDFKRLLAFHSVSQLGYVVTAIGVGLISTGSIANLGLAGGLYHMINHATFKCLLFLCAGAILYRTGTTDLNKMSGLSKKMPFTTIVFIIAAAAISGIPPFNGFASKWLIYQATYECGLPFVAVIAIVVSSMTLASFIKVIHSAFFGPERKEVSDIKDVPLSMKIPMGILAAMCLIFGLFTKIIMNKVLVPVIGSIRSLPSYIDNMISQVGSSSTLINFKIEPFGYYMDGVYRPEVFLALFFVIAIGIIIATQIINKGIGFKKNSINVPNNRTLDTKYEVFTGGEKDELAKVGPHDLFWGLKFTFKGYFSRLSNAHSGIVNDYALWVVVTLAVVLIYCGLFFRGVS